MAMYQILKIDECISFLTLNKESGEKYSTPKNKQILQ